MVLVYIKLHHLKIITASVLQVKYFRIIFYFYVNNHFKYFNLGFEGKNCEGNIDECKTATCPFGKICIDGINSYDCACPEGYTGENCSKLSNDCRDHLCKNNSTCIEDPDGYSCRCASGFTGTKHY